MGCAPLVMLAAEDAMEILKIIAHLVSPIYHNPCLWNICTTSNASVHSQARLFAIQTFTATIAQQAVKLVPTSPSATLVSLDISFIQTPATPNAQLEPWRMTRQTHAMYALQSVTTHAMAASAVDVFPHTCWSMENAQQIVGKENTMMERIARVALKDVWHVRTQQVFVLIAILANTPWVQAEVFARETAKILNTG